MNGDVRGVAKLNGLPTVGGGQRGKHATHSSPRQETVSWTGRPVLGGGGNEFALFIADQSLQNNRAVMGWVWIPKSMTTAKKFVNTTSRAGWELGELHTQSEYFFDFFGDRLAGTETLNTDSMESSGKDKMHKKETRNRKILQRG